MNKNILVLPLLLLSVLWCYSCGDDDEVVLSSDCYISSFTLGTVIRSAVMTSSTGEDSVYYVSYDASGYCMNINQLEGTIENHDSLPLNTSVRALLVTVATSGSVIYRQADEEEENWAIYSSKDSIDFTHPQIFRVISADGSAWRDYRVSVNVHQVDGEAFVWKKISQPALWASADSLRLLVWNEKAWVFAKEGTAVRVFCSSVEDGMQWEEVLPTGCEQADVNTLMAFDGSLYMSCADGSLVCSGDAKNWVPVESEPDGLRLVATDDTSLYALSGNAIWRSSDGRTWTEEALDDEPSFLPTQDVASVSYVQSNGVRKVMLIGNRSQEEYPADMHAMVWGRGTLTGTEVPLWMYYNASSDNNYLCPRLSSLQLLHYGDVLMAFGGESLDGTSHEAFDAFYVSEDNGITWKTSTVYVFPDGVGGTGSVLAAATDAQNYLWLVTGDEVWRGRLNKFGF